MNPIPQPRFEEQVRSTAGGQLNRYLAAAPNGAQVLVGVLVRTVVPLSPGGSGAIRETLEEVSLASGRATLQVRFEVATGLPDGFEVRCEPITNAGARIGLPRREPPAPGGRGHLLTLSFNTLRFDYLLAPGPDWWALARPPDRRGGEGFLLPQSMSSVPSGFLLEIRLDTGRLLVRRTGDRPEIVVAVNGVALHPALPAGLPVDWRGQIAFWHGQSQVCALDYQLADWAPARPSPAGPPDPGDGASHIVSLAVGTRTGSLHIAPPQRTDRVVDRRFPIPAASTHERAGYLDAQVLYTAGTWFGGDPRDWHVKIYRCATPQHADQLRRYLRTQASLIERVNAAVGGTGQAPPWAVAPVTVIGPAADPRHTRFYVSDEEVRDDPENRLSAWFGVPERPQPNSFVIVVSPMLRKVGWAEAELHAGAPGIDQLSYLMPLAVGLDQCHELGIAHCDIKPANVCRNTRTDGDSGYVLIDGDAVCRTRERLVDLRLTHTYASPRIADQWHRSYDGSTEADLREHDRFGFALVVLAAVAGVDRVDLLLAQDERGERPVDTPDIVTAAITTWWPARWADFAGALAGPFQYDALVGDRWTAVGWLTWLTQLGTAPVDPPAVPPGPEQRFAGVYARHLAEIRDEVLATPRGPKAVLPAVVDRVAEHQLAVARAAYWKTVRLWGLLPLLIGLTVLIGVIVGR